MKVDVEVGDGPRIEVSWRGVSSEIDSGTPAQVSVFSESKLPAKVEIKTGSAPVGGSGGSSGPVTIGSVIGLQTALDTEATNRAAGDASLEAQIDGEVTRAFTAEQDLQQQVDDEGAARVAALAAEAAQRAADIAAAVADLRGGAPADRDNLEELGALWAETDTDLAAALTALTGKANTNDIRFNPPPGALPDGTMVATESGLYVAKTPAQVRAALNVANGATANFSDGYLLDRANHTGSQAPSTITGTAVVTNDSRLSDARTPVDASVTAAKLAPEVAAALGPDAIPIVSASRSGTAAVYGTPLIDFSATQDWALGLGIMVGGVIRGRAGSSLTFYIRTTATSLTAGQSVILARYALDADGMPTGEPTWTENILAGGTFGKCTSGATIRSLSGSPEALFILNPSTNAGSVTITATNNGWGAPILNPALASRPWLQTNATHSVPPNVTGWTASTAAGIGIWGLTPNTPIIFATR